jgi:hypothetical protein
MCGSRTLSQLSLGPPVASHALGLSVNGATGRPRVGWLSRRAGVAIRHLRQLIPWITHARPTFAARRHHGGWRGAGRGSPSVTGRGPWPVNVVRPRLRLAGAPRGPATLVPSPRVFQPRPGRPVGHGWEEHVMASAEHRYGDCQVAVQARHVWDISQTTGEPLPEVQPLLLHGDVSAGLADGLVFQIEGEGYTVRDGVRHAPRATGQTDPMTRTVTIRAGLPGRPAGEDPGARARAHPAWPCA